MSSDDPKRAAEPVQVYIFNQTYHLRSGSDSDYVRRIARLVDERMRQLSSHSSQHDALKIAVLTALNIADEMQRLKDRYEGEGSADALKSPEDAGAEKGADANGRGSDARSWFEDIFDSDEPPKRSGERLSSLVSSKLQTLRQPSQEPTGTDDKKESPK